LSKETPNYSMTSKLKAIAKVAFLEKY